MPVTVVDKPKDEASRKGPRNEQQKRIQGARYQLFQAKTYAADKSPSVAGSGTTTYTVDIPRCDENCQCLIVASVDGRVRGHVDADASDYFVGKARGLIDGKLFSSLGGSPAQLTLVSGDGAESYEASADVSGPNAKIVGKVGDGPLDKVSAYSSGPVSIDKCYADITVTAEGSANSFINWACSDDSYGEAIVTITRDCKISAYCVCKGERTLIFEWSRGWDSGSSYTKRSDKDKEYELKLKRDRDEMGTLKTEQPMPKREAKSLEQLDTGRKPRRRSSEDGLSRTRQLFKNQLSKSKG